MKKIKKFHLLTIFKKKQRHTILNTWFQLADIQRCIKKTLHGRGYNSCALKRHFFEQSGICLLPPPLNKTPKKICYRKASRKKKLRSSLTRLTSYYCRGSVNKRCNGQLENATNNLRIFERSEGLIKSKNGFEVPWYVKWLISLIFTPHEERIQTQIELFDSWITRTPHTIWVTELWKLRRKSCIWLESKCPLDEPTALVHTYNIQ